MLSDLIDLNNYASYNITLAQLVGLEAAVYCNQLLSIQNKAKRKEKLEEGFFKVDRNFIVKQTSISKDNQLKLDEQLVSIGILEKRDTNLLNINLENLSTIIAGESLDLKKEVATICKEKKKTKKECIIEQLKRDITCDNSELREALEGWIDSIYTGPKAYLSKAAVTSFQDDLYNYSKGDLDVALAIVKIASISAWRNCQWAINAYEQNNKKSVRTTQQKVATSVSQEAF